MLKAGCVLETSRYFNKNVDDNILIAKLDSCNGIYSKSSEEKINFLYNTIIQIF